AADRLAADDHLVQLPQQQGQRLAAPAAAQQAEGAGGEVQQPGDHQGRPQAAKTPRRSPWAVAQAVQALLLEAVFPAGNSAAGAVKDGTDSGPSVAVGQQQQQVGT